MNSLVVHAFWDAEAEVWVAHSEDVPGLVTGAKTLEALMAKLEVVIPELLELNAPQVIENPIPYSLHVDRTLHRAA
jgi:predicted RNase H-like HicB family nuclease